MTKLARLLTCATLIVTMVPTMTDAQTLPTTRPETPEHTARIKWWRQAKFGMFIHWGLYSLPAGTWKDKKIAGIGEWIMNRAQIPVKEYEQLATQFNPTKFDADAWAQLAKDAGMKYMVITSKHHDGFAMYHSAVSKYNIVDATPFKRDPMKELSKACDSRGIKFGFYYSQAQDWHEPGGWGNTWDFGPDEDKDKSGAYDKYLKEKAEPQVKEILDGYGPICLIWFDTPRGINYERAKRLHDIVRSLQPNCLIDGRLGAPELSDYDSEGDNHYPGGVRGGDWETPATLNDTWGFKSYDHHWKSPQEVIFLLMECVSKGGNFLLNVGPTSEGLMPQASIDILHDVGAWMKVNGDAVYGAGPTPFGKEFGEPTEKKDRRGRTVWNVNKEWRCTTQPGKMYFTIFEWPYANLALTVPYSGSVGKAYFLADPSKELKVTQSGGNTTIALPAEPPDPVATVVVLEVPGK